MILEDATHEAFGYYPSALSIQSGKLIIAACEMCGEFKIAPKHGYRTFCKSCAMKGNISALGCKRSDVTKAKISTAEKGKKLSEETKAKMSVAKKGTLLSKKTKAKMSAAKKCEKNYNWRGGRKLACARCAAKRDRELGYILLMPLKEGEDGHHVTNEYVIGIPAEVHQKLGGGSSRRKHRTRILQWLKASDKKKYKLALCVLAKEPLLLIQMREI